MTVSAEDEARVEPVLALAVLEHVLQRADADASSAMP